MSSLQRPDGINDAQWQAVTYQDGHLLIVAGPGTGKTHTLTHRIFLLTEKLSAHEEILAITFTQKAALEMQKRLVALDKKAAAKCFVGTFHQFASTLLRQYLAAAGAAADFQIASEEQIEKIATELWPDLSKKERKEMLARISRNKAVDFAQGLSEETLLYNRRLRRDNLLDYDDLLLNVWRLFDSTPEALEEVQRKYRHVFVDEYQDVNPVQHALLKQLVGGGVLLTAIGDPNQSIYGFRGSHVGFFHQFATDFPGAKQFVLTDNYRSVGDILKASEKMLAQSVDAIVPQLTANIYKEGRLVIHECPTEKAESEYVVHTIEKMVGGTSMFSRDSGRIAQNQETEIAFDDIVVLYRLHSQAAALKEAFERSGIPYHIVQRKTEVNDDVCPVPQEHLEFVSAKVHLMTMHAAKGLEFDTVFIVGSEYGLIPLDLGEMKGDIEEERRLFYVAMTRAKRNLFFTHIKKRMMYGKTSQQKLSPFVVAIEEELKKEERTSKKRKTEKQLSLFK